MERRADLHVAQLMPLPLTVSCFSKIQIGFTFLVPAHPGSPRQRAIKRAYNDAVLGQQMIYGSISALHVKWTIDDSEHCILKQYKYDHHQQQHNNSHPYYHSFYVSF